MLVPQCMFCVILNIFKNEMLFVVKVYTLLFDQILSFFSKCPLYHNSYLKFGEIFFLMHKNNPTGLHVNVNVKTCVRVTEKY